MQTVMNELFLSSVLGKPVINQHGHEIGTPWDLVMTPGEVFPEVSNLLIKKGKNIFSFPWHDIVLFNSFVISIATRSGALPPEKVKFSSSTTSWTSRSWMSRERK